MLDKLIRKLRHSTWPETQAEVQTCRYRNVVTETYHRVPHVPWAPTIGAGISYPVTFIYTVNGQTYDGGFESPAEVQKGDKFPIRYNPANPARNSAEPYGDWEKYYDWVLAIVIISAATFFCFRK